MPRRGTSGPPPRRAARGSGDAAALRGGRHVRTRAQPRPFRGSPDFVLYSRARPVDVEPERSVDGEVGDGIGPVPKSGAASAAAPSKAASRSCALARATTGSQSGRTTPNGNVRSSSPPRADRATPPAWARSRSSRSSAVLPIPAAPSITARRPAPATTARAPPPAPRSPARAPGARPDRRGGGVADNAMASRIERLRRLRARKPFGKPFGACP